VLVYFLELLNAERVWREWHADLATVRGFWAVVIGCIGRN